jgi:PTH1 family peptidyl-tRNA hydrolase
VPGSGDPREAQVAAIKLIVGLGNPGDQYSLTRHNAGFWFVDELARRCQAEFRPEKRFHGVLAQCRSRELDCRLFKPATFMNRSGLAVAAISRFFDIPREAVLVVHDELDLPPGTARVKQGGGHGGHNGLRDLISHLGGGDFYRLRLGIGHPGHRDQVVDYVLRKPSREDRALIEDAIGDALEVIPEVVDGQFARAMNLLHAPKRG